MAIEASKSILESVLKTAHEKAIPHDAPPPKTEAPAVKPPVAAAPVVPKIEDTAKELEAAKARAAELETKLGVSEKTIGELKTLEKARELWKGKKRLEALEILAGADTIDEDLDELTKEWIAAPSKQTKTAVEEKLDQLLERDAKREAAEAAAKKAEEDAKIQSKKDADEKAKADNIAYSTSILAKHADEFDLCNREKNKQEACEKAPLIALACLRRDKVDLATLTSEQAEKAMVEALTEIESDLEKEGIARFLKKTKETPPPQVRVETEKTPDPAIRVPSPVIKTKDPKKPASVMDVIEQAKQRAQYQ